VFKVVMAIAGLESGVIDPQHAVHCAGSVNIYGRERLCWKEGGHGTVRLREALAYSCNVYFYLLGKQLGIERIDAYGTMFGLGQLTRIDLPGEARGILGSPEWKRRKSNEPWYPGDTISVAIGQGLLAVTPVQMATMISAVASGGRLPQPHLNREARSEPATIDISRDTLDRVRQALRDAVRQGTGRSAELRGVGVAGKTGTAQVYKHSAGIDSDKLPKAERDHAWFVGYAPADDPAIAFAVVVEHGGHGGSVAAPIARHVLEVFFSDDDGSGDESQTDRAERSGPAPGGAGGDPARPAG
jgi:penicillin-binding protein 2